MIGKDEASNKVRTISMRYWCLMMLILMGVSWADIGRITKLQGKTDAYIFRGNSKFAVSKDLKLKARDEIFSHDTQMVIDLYPGHKVILAKNSQIKITGKNTIDFIKGRIQVQVTKELKVQGDGVAFNAKEAVFEVSQTENKDFDLDVVSGEVEVTSPYVHTFVPEIVKAQEGFRFTTAESGFARRKFSPKINVLSN